jgi:hypothetical protein
MEAAVTVWTLWPFSCTQTTAAVPPTYLPAAAILQLSTPQAQPWSAGVGLQVQAAGCGAAQADCISLQTQRRVQVSLMCSKRRQMWNQGSRNQKADVAVGWTPPPGPAVTKEITYQGKANN